MDNQAVKVQKAGERYDIGSIKTRARAILSSGNNRLTIAVSLLIFITTSVTCLYIGYMFIEAFQHSSSGEIAYWLINIGYILWVAMTALFGNLPILYGLYAVTVRMCRGEDVKPIDVFEVFSEKELYKKAILLSSQKILMYIVPFSVAVLFPYFHVRIAVCALTVPFSFFVTGFGSAASVYAGSEQDMHGKRKKVIKYRSSFIPLMLLSVVTIGVLFIIHTIPYAMISNILYAEHLAGIESKESN